MQSNNARFSKGRSFREEEEKNQKAQVSGKGANPQPQRPESFLVDLSWSWKYLFFILNTYSSISLAFLKRFPKLRVLFEKKPQKPTLEEEITEETRSDILTTTSNMPEKTSKNKNSMPKCLDFQENETNASFFSEENGKNDSLVVLRNMWEKIYEHFGA